MLLIHQTPLPCFINTFSTVSPIHLFTLFLKTVDNLFFYFFPIFSRLVLLKKI